MMIGSERARWTGLRTSVVLLVGLLGLARAATADAGDGRFAPAETTHAVRTVIGAGGTATPEGEWIPEPIGAYEIMVADGEPVTVTYAANDGLVIDQLFSDGALLPAASGEASYAWERAAVHADVSNVVTFVRQVIYDWYSAFEDFDRSRYSAATLHGAWLANVHPDEALAIATVGVTEAGAPHLTWRSLGPAHGLPQVHHAANLRSAVWRPSYGPVQHDGGTNTWMAEPVERTVWLSGFDDDGTWMRYNLDTGVERQPETVIYTEPVRIDLTWKAGTNGTITLWNWLHADPSAPGSAGMTFSLSHDGETQTLTIGNRYTGWAIQSWVVTNLPDAFITLDILMDVPASELTVAVDGVTVLDAEPWLVFDEAHSWHPGIPSTLVGEGTGGPHYVDRIRIDHDAGADVWEWDATFDPTTDGWFIRHNAQVYDQERDTLTLIEPVPESGFFLLSVLDE